MASPRPGAPSTEILAGGTYQALGVLAHDRHVDHPSSSAFDALDGANVGVEIHDLAEGDDGTRVALDTVARARDGTEHGSVALVLEDVDRELGKGHARLLEELEPGVELDEGRRWDPGHSSEDPLCGLWVKTMISTKAGWVRSREGCARGGLGDRFRRR